MVLCPTSHGKLVHTSKRNNQAGTRDCGILSSSASCMPSTWSVLCKQVQITGVTLIEARWQPQVTYLRSARASRAQTQAAGSKCSILLFFPFYGSFPCPEPSMASCGPGDLPSGPFGSRGQSGRGTCMATRPRALRRGCGWCSRCKGTTGPLPGHETSTPRPSISC